MNHLEANDQSELERFWLEVSKTDVSSEMIRLPNAGRDRLRVNHIVIVCVFLDPVSSALGRKIHQNGRLYKQRVVVESDSYFVHSEFHALHCKQDI